MEDGAAHDDVARAEVGVERACEAERQEHPARSGVEQGRGLRAGGASDADDAGARRGLGVGGADELAARRRDGEERWAARVHG